MDTKAALSSSSLFGILVIFSLMQTSPVAAFERIENIIGDGGKQQN